MFILHPLPFVRDFIELLDETLATHQPGCPLSRIQKTWLSFCVTAVLLSQRICWAQFERASLGGYRMAALSWMFRHSKIMWEALLPMSVGVILRSYGIREGMLVIDDSDKRRSKRTGKLAHVHKLKDKATGGYVMGQSIVFLVLVTPVMTIPVSFAFYQPDPVLKAWEREDKALKAKGVPPRNRPPKPERNPAYPTKQTLALRLLRQFRLEHPQVHVKVVLADALYGTAAFMEEASAIYDGLQVITQLRSNQNIRYRTKVRSLQAYFATHPGVPQTIRLRGGKTLTVWVSSARLYVCAHQAKRFVIALKYEDEDDYRYLVARDLTWRTLDIVQAHTFRWLVEVFLQDWKAHEGWDRLTKQHGDEGASRSLILSLLVDHCLFFHPRQKAQLENKLPAFTVGSLQHHIQVEALLAFIEGLLAAEDPHQQVAKIIQALEKHTLSLRPSTKHMMGRDLGRLESTPSLKYRATG
jgi:hypothetical protein